MAPWFLLHLPSCGPGFESQAHHLRFFQFVLLKLYRENYENKQKEAGIGPFFKKDIKAILPDDHGKNMFFILNFAVGFWTHFANIIGIGSNCLTFYLPQVNDIICYHTYFFFLLKGFTILNGKVINRDLSFETLRSVSHSLTSNE